MASKTNYMRGYRNEYLSSDPETRGLKSVTRMREVHFKNADKTDLTKVPSLYGKTFNYKVIPDTEDKRAIKEVRVVGLYPKCVRCEFSLGKETKKYYICLGIGDLVTSGLLTFANGYPEVVTKIPKDLNWFYEQFNKEAGL